MSGEEDDKGPYRTPLDRPPPSGPRRSPRVLSGLAQLRSAKGDVEESAALSERAALARASAPARPLARCMDGLEALRRYDRRAARKAFTHWLDMAVDQTPRDEDRLEVLSALATISSGVERESALIGASGAALDKVFDALQFVNVDRNSPAMLPALSSALRVFTEADRPTRALAVQQDIESIHALYGCGSP